ncbi:MAG: response regulator [Burkholderiales bacterium]|nr:response regulator [Anaerolineae bacterium]
MKILVADDNEDNRQLIRDILEGMGHEIIESADGPKTIALTQAALPDLVILDVNMPGMSGFAVCAILKGDSATAQIPVLMLTAMADVEARVQGLGSGADDYLTKPFNPRELKARIQTRLRAKVETDGLRETQQMIRSTFERFVSPAVVEQLLANPAQVALGGRLQEVTVLFTDLENFTGISERAEPEKLLSILNMYHSLVVRIILEHAGTVDKFIGDGVMALFNTPLEQSDHALRAVKSALDIREALPEFYKGFEARYRMRINFGIHSGMAVVGNVGTSEIMDFTAVGDTVNLAARLQGLARSSQILVSEATYARVLKEVNAKMIGSLTVKGRSEPVMAYEVVELLA